MISYWQGSIPFNISLLTVGRLCLVRFPHLNNGDKIIRNSLMKCDFTKVLFNSHPNQNIKLGFIFVLLLSQKREGGKEQDKPQPSTGCPHRPFHFSFSAISKSIPNSSHFLWKNIQNSLNFNQKVYQKSDLVCLSLCTFSWVAQSTTLWPCLSLSL